LISNSINLILKNNLAFDDSFPILFEKNYKEISFLNNEKATSNYSNKHIENLKHFNDNSSNINKNENLNNLNNKNKNIFRICKDFSKIKYQNYDNFIKIDRYKNYKSYNNLYKIEKCNNIFINSNNNSEKERKSINNLNNIDNLSNEIKVKKNNKMIYINKLLIKPKNKKKDMILLKKKRNSIYRGVSKNGNKWQVIIFSKYKKSYIGLYNTQEIAGRIYDIISIKNKGIKAKTNYIYNIHQIQKIIDSNIDYKSENIEEIISHLIKEK